MIFEFTEDMNEISGLGGAHERAMRAAVIAGARWWLMHPGGAPAIGGDDTRCVALNSEGESLLRAINETTFNCDDGVKVPLASMLSPTMYYGALYHIMWIGKHGWAHYTNAMRLPLAFYADEPRDASHESHS